MKLFMTLTMVSFLLLKLLTFNVGAQTNLQDYGNLISKISNEYKKSSVTILHSSEYENLREANLIVDMTRKLSKGKIMSVTADFRIWNQLQRQYFGKDKGRTRIHKPLIVTFLSTEESLKSFQKIVRKLRHKEQLLYLVLFIKSDEQPLLDFCMKPVGNPFKLRLDALMVVKCYDDNALRVWYTLDGDNLLTATLAIWHPQTEVLKMILESKEEKINLGGKELTVGTVNSSVINVWKKNGQLGGFFGDLLNVLKESMNFTYKINKKVDDYGIWNTTDKHWTGAMGLLSAREVDFVLSDMTMDSIRMPVVDFSIPLIFSRNILYVRKPKSGYTVKWVGYFQFFDIRLWGVIVLLILITPLILTWMKVKILKSYVLPILIFDNYFNIWGIYCQQGLLEFPTTSPLRLAYFSIFSSAMITSYHYSAVLISHLSYPAPNNPLPNLEAFVKDGTYKLIVLKNSADYNFFQFSKDPTVKAMFQLMVKDSDLPTNVEEGFKMICEQKMGFYINDVSSKIRPFNIKCDFHEIISKVFDILAIGLPKGSQYKNEINRILSKFTANGASNRLKNFYFHNNQLEENEHNKVTISATIVLLVIVAGGMILGIIILLMEKAIFSRRKTKVSEIKIQKLITPENFSKWYNFENQKRNPDRYDKDGNLNIKFLRNDYKHRVVVSPGDHKINFRA